MTLRETLMKKKAENGSKYDPKKGYDVIVKTIRKNSGVQSA